MSWLLHLFYRLVFTISFERKKSKARTCTCWKSTNSGFRLRIEIYIEASNVPFFPMIYFHDTSQLPYQRKMHLDKIMRLSNCLKVIKWNIYFHTHLLQILSTSSQTRQTLHNYWPINLYCLTKHRDENILSP